MTIELYTAPINDSQGPVDSPISNTIGELPDQEPTLDLGDLLGSFDSQDEALDFIQNQTLSQGQSVIDTVTVLFNPYTHVELLTVTIQNEDQSTHPKSYYLVTDEGY
ncbi:hypothetical protein EXU85_25085 [Spirosoma sp. KCTC 42546]|uniref:hypothetical protein n=1 Tax=Spirosoma sp. KCTC 42546 TaxID=2520506 RepID=UPI00115C2FA1|nr:hypothetical protein [Spirosoma sp. KCTC 42546]QDK81706.1 hypothetical protein EXU85_25085 [Spirosoma sp. KCTC 42546]